MSTVSDLDGPFGRTFSILWMVKQFLIDSGREDKAAEFLEKAIALDPDELKSLISEYVDIDWAHQSLDWY
jgi:hypothetical protein